MLARMAAAGEQSLEERGVGGNLSAVAAKEGAEVSRFDDLGAKSGPTVLPTPAPLPVPLKPGQP